jgi:hypothetical protein
MAELAQAPAAGEGTPAAAPEGTPAAVPVTTEGHAPAAEGSSETGHPATTGPGTQQEEAFFDRSKVPPELLPAYKEMQSAWTKRMMGLSQDKELLDQAKAFIRDPITGMQQLARQHGYILTRAEAAAAVANQNQPQPWDPESGQDPPDWKTLMSTAEARAEQRIMQKFGPIIENVQKLQATSIEKQLDDLDPQWRTYEDAMRENLRDHPTLVKDINKLYRLSVPAEVIEARATQAALNRLSKNANSARVSGTSSARGTVAAPREVKTFADAVEAAKEQLGKK